MDISTTVCLAILDINYPIEDNSFVGDYFGYSVTLIKDSVIIGSSSLWVDGPIGEISYSSICNLARLAYKDSGKKCTDFEIEIMFFHNTFWKFYDKSKDICFVEVKNGIYENVSREYIKNIEGSTTYSFPVHKILFNIKSVLYNSKLYTNWKEKLLERFKNSDNVFILNTLYSTNNDEKFRNHCINIINLSKTFNRSFIQLSLKVYSVEHMKYYIPYFKTNKLEYGLLLLGIKSKKIKYYTKKILSTISIEDLFEKYDVEQIASVIIYCVNNKSHWKQMIKVSDHLSKIFKLNSESQCEINLSKIFYLFCILSRYCKAQDCAWECFLKLFKKISSTGMIINNKNEEDIISTIRVLESLANYLRID